MGNLDAQSDKQKDCLWKSQSGTHSVRCQEQEKIDIQNSDHSSEYVKTRSVSLQSAIEKQNRKK